MINYENNYTQYCLQSPSINVWKENLKKYLSNKSEGTMDLYIVSKDWLDKFEEKLNTNFNFSQFKEKFKNTIYTFPKMFVLDKDYGQGDNVIVKGIFKNSVLLIDMSKYTNTKLYSYFYLLQNQLIQGYLIIHQLDKEKYIINQLFNIGPYNLSYKNKKEYNKNHKKILDIIIYDDYEKLNESKINSKRNIVNNQHKVNNVKDVKQIYYKKEIPKENFKSEKTKAIENKNMLNDPPNDKENIIIKKKSSKKINININSVHNEGQNSKKSDALNPKKLIIKKNNKRIPSVQINKKMIGSQRMIDKFSLEKFLPNKAIHNKSTPGLIGLLNIGATCYMNATLQCFSNIGRLRTYLLNKEIYKELENEKDTNKKLSFSFAEVLKNLWVKLEQRFYSPDNFKNVISEKNPLFKGVAANDPKDLIIFLLQTMHEELNNPPKNKINNNIIPNENNLNEVFYCFANEYKNNNNSIISDEFYGYTNSFTTCEFCKYQINNVQVINILFFPLEEIRKYKNTKHNNVSILDCFEYHEKVNIYPSFYCNYCKRNCNAYSQNKIVYSPRTLIINLNRGRGLEFNVNIIYEEYLNLRKFIYFENSPYYYELIGVICHFGSNDDGGHFIAYCKNSENCEWYKYNDQFVTKCYFDEVKKAKLPYVLFYSYVQTS